MVKRAAFTMIELIFAIVVVAIGVLSLPMISEVNSQTAGDTMKVDEAVFEAYSAALDMFTQRFDKLEDNNNADANIRESTNADSFKFATKVVIDVQKNVPFEGAISDPDIALVTVEVTDSQTQEVITRMYTYNFNVIRQDEK